MARLLVLLRPQVPNVSLAVLCLASSTGLGVAAPLVLRAVVDAAIAGQGVRALAVDSALYLFVVIGTIVATWSQRALLARVALAVLTTLRVSLVERILRLPLATLDGMPSGKLIATTMGDVDALRDFLTGPFLNVVADTLFFAGMAAAMVGLDVQLAVVPLAALPVLLWMLVRYERVARPRSLELRRQRAELAAFFAERIRGIQVLQAADRIAWTTDACNRLGEEYYRTQMRSMMPANWLIGGVILVQAIVAVSVLVVGGGRCVAGTLTVGTLIAFLDYMRRYNEPVFRWSNQFQIIERARAAASRVFALLDCDTEPATLAVPAQARSARRGEIRFEDVWFSYDKGPAPANWVLRAVSFDVPAGKRFALVGPTGHGKSTILSLLLRLYVPQRGRILLDGEDLNAIPLVELRTRVGLVTQDVRLFPGTVAENILFGRTGDARRALESVGGFEAIEKLTDGVDTKVGDGGAGLSQGERQLIVCARTIARAPEVLLLDEATASVDPVTEERLETALVRLMADRSVLVVAHRLSTLRNADRILVIRDGEIAESGTRAELLARNGRYAELERLQMSTHASTQATA